MNYKDLKKYIKELNYTPSTQVFYKTNGGTLIQIAGVARFLDSVTGSLYLALRPKLCEEFVDFTVNTILVGLGTPCSDIDKKEVLVHLISESGSISINSVFMQEDKLILTYN